MQWFGEHHQLSCFKEHPTGIEYAEYLNQIAKYFKLPILENTSVIDITQTDHLFDIHISNGTPLRTKFVIWAAGEFQYPNLDIFPGAELCLHNSKVNTWKDITGDDIYIIGGYESGIDAAIHLSQLGKTVTVLEKNPIWEQRTTDPSHNLSPFTLERLRKAIKEHNQIKLIGGCDVKKVSFENNKYNIHVTGSSKHIESNSRPILSTGFSSSMTMINHLFDWNQTNSYCLLTSDDESSLTPGLFLVGPQVRHEKLIFCFIYKFRQRFGVVAHAITKRLNIPTPNLQSYRNDGLFLDDLSSCADECVC